MIKECGEITAILNVKDNAAILVVINKMALAQMVVNHLSGVKIV